MKAFIAVFLLVCISICACQSPEIIAPIGELEVEVKSCHLSAKAIIQYRKSYNGNDPFYYLTLLDANGKEIGDVYTSSIQNGKLEVGEVVSIVFHYEISNGEGYVSACGSEPEHQPTAEEMTKVVVCKGIS